jgi:hypothetical protein
MAIKMSHTHSLSARALGLRPSQVVKVTPNSGLDFDISGCNPTAARAVRNSLCYDARGRLRIRPDSLVARSGAQIRLLQPDR